MGVRGRQRDNSSGRESYGVPGATRRGDEQSTLNRLLPIMITFSFIGFRDGYRTVCAEATRFAQPRL